MADPNRPQVDLSESSIYGQEDSTPARTPTDIATEIESDRLEAITGDAIDQGGIYQSDPDPELDQHFDALDASTEEEIDALKVNLMQDDAPAPTRDGSGRIVDDLAEEQVAEFTEVGPMLPGYGAESVTPGRDDTSAQIRKSHPNTEIARSETIVEGNIGADSDEDEPLDETGTDTKVDQGAGA